MKYSKSDFFNLIQKEINASYDEVSELLDSETDPVAEQTILAQHSASVQALYSLRDKVEREPSGSIYSASEILTFIKRERENCMRCYSGYTGEKAKMRMLAADDTFRAVIASAEKYFTGRECQMGME
jgi:hypothetical protein